MDSDNQPLFSEMDVPRDIEVCPECGSQIAIETVEQWDTETGLPTEGGLYVGCIADSEALEHRYWQSDWQPVTDKVHAWVIETHTQDGSQSVT